jgi:23S rRNA (cytidine1920-2'-O)/16S rRNA (cytidine1409-2'-O)-methyltransferase
MIARTRLDVWLTENGHADSREKAQALVMAGRVRINGQPATKAGAALRLPAEVEVVAAPEHVGRGALKLVAALDTFGVSPAGRLALDIGASTGGFSQVLLERGALRVYAVDAGRGQLHEKLRADPRMVVLERTNARFLSASEIPEACDLVTIDVSFISALKILPALRAVTTPDADLLVLVKPQFEVGRAQVGKGGIVRDPALHLQALREVAGGAQDGLGYAVEGVCPSPILGSEGNREFFLHLRAGGTPLVPDALLAALAAVAQA